MKLIATPEEITAELLKMQEFLEVEISEETAEAVYRGNMLEVFIARSGKLLADAKYHFNKAKQNKLIANVKEVLKFTPSVANEFAKSLTADEERLFLWAEQINKTCKYQSDWCRTLISKGKEEMRFSHFSNQA
ncbi:MAG: hypothetical protein LBE36_13375 [Flavobacteriaceae bacterium]|jgi:hypothetical protein|nr:hypothetical protein [Flavobacteriaceae bacterium]